MHCCGVVVVLLWIEIDGERAGDWLSLELRAKQINDLGFSVLELSGKIMLKGG